MSSYPYPGPRTPGCPQATSPRPGSPPPNLKQNKSNRDTTASAPACPQASTTPTALASDLKPSARPAPTPPPRLGEHWQRLLPEHLQPRWHWHWLSSNIRVIPDCSTPTSCIRQPSAETHFNRLFESKCPERALSTPTRDWCPTQSSIYKARPPRSTQDQTFLPATALACQLATRFKALDRTVRNIWNGRQWRNITRPLWTEPSLRRKS